MMRYFVATFAVLGLCFVVQSPLAAKPPGERKGGAQKSGDPRPNKVRPSEHKPGEIKGGEHKGPEHKDRTRPFDTDGDGKLNPAEKAAAHDKLDGPRPGHPPIELLLRKFDANGNGKLDPPERLKAKEALEAFKERQEQRQSAAHVGDISIPAEPINDATAGASGQPNQSAKEKPIPGGRPVAARPGQTRPVKGPGKGTGNGPVNRPAR